jgi:hypothetical protein
MREWIAAFINFVALSVKSIVFLIIGASLKSHSIGQVAFALDVLQLIQILWTCHCIAIGIR